MIGGVEIKLSAKGCRAPLELAVRAITHHWPRAVFEDAVTAQRYAQIHEIPFAKIDELFVYRDAQAADVWDAEGAVPAAHNTMIHIIADEGLITLVVDENDVEMQKNVAAVASAVGSTVAAAGRRIAS